MSCAGALHDTVGICYQIQPSEQQQQQHKQVVAQEHQQLTEEHRDEHNEAGKPQKRKRTFDLIEGGIEPYRKKPHISTFEYDRTDFSVKPNNLHMIQKLDTAWMISTYVSNETPMWIGWNSQLIHDDMPKKNVCYMDNICLPPTQLDVVVKTMEMSQKVAEECQQEYAVVHYDLAIAKIAKTIQQTESPRFNNLFVCFGGFHIQMAYFKALGHVISDSGGAEILVNSEVLGKGSLNGFVDGKHFNRCKRLHPLLANALSQCHLRQFIDDYHMPIPEDLTSNLMNINTAEPSQEDLSQVLESPFILAYQEYAEKTRSGDHGPTAQFWLQYIDLVQDFQNFSRATRTNDIDLFIYSLGELIPMFFAAGQPNYSRWMVHYVLDLLNAPDSVRETLTKGGLSVKRSSKTFSCIPVDLTLEQTVNADAASRQTGITSFTNSEAARKRWMVTRTVRSQIIGDLLNMAGLKEGDDCTKELKSHRIKKDNADLQATITGIKECMNPFENNSNQLICLSSGRACSDSVKSDLLHCKDIGRQWRNDFLNECLEDGKQFERPIKRHKVKNFGSDAVTMKIKKKDKKIQEVQATRDLLGRILYLARTSNFDLGYVLKYPLTPVPLSLCDIAGTKHTTSKAALKTHLEDNKYKTEPEHIDVGIFDAMCLLHTLINVPATYGGIAKSVLATMCAVGPEIHFVCDTYRSPSIKDIERDSRADGKGSNITVSGSQQRVKYFHECLSSSNFKTSLLDFFVREWQDNSYASILAGHDLFVGNKQEGWTFTTDGKIVTRERVAALDSNHEEADSRMVWHLSYIIRQHPEAPNVSIRATDTDIFILLLHHAPNMDARLWVDTGRDSDNTRKYINMSKMSQDLGNVTCKALPGYHAFTGCDYTASFFGKGKVRPYKQMLKHAFALEAFGFLGESVTVPSEVRNALQRFVCIMYGLPKLSSVDQAREMIFDKKYAPANKNQPFEKIKKVDASSLPPCLNTLVEKINRSNYIAYMWKRANHSDPHTPDPEECGWIKIESKYQLNWYVGNQIPDNLQSTVEEDGLAMDSDDSTSEYESDYESDESIDSDSD